MGKTPVILHFGIRSLLSALLSQIFVSDYSEIIMFRPFGPNIISFVWIWTLLLFLFRGLFLLEFLSNRLQALTQ